MIGMNEATWRHDIQQNDTKRNDTKQEPYSQHFNFFVT